MMELPELTELPEVMELPEVTELLEVSDTSASKKLAQIKHRSTESLE